MTSSPSFFILPFALALNNLAISAPQEAANAETTPPISGVLVPNPKKTTSITWEPKALSSLPVLSVTPHGSEIAKGKPLISIDFTKLNQALADAKLQAESDQLTLEKTALDLETAKNQAELRIEKAQRTLTRATEDLEDFQKLRRPRLIADNDAKLEKAKNFVLYKAEELKQLEKLYTDDQMTDETEEIVLTRTKNELRDLKFGLEGTELEANLAKKRKFTRLDQDTAEIQLTAKRALDQATKEIAIELAQKELALTAAKTKAARSAEAYKNLENDLNLAKFLSPTRGIVIYGGLQNNLWNGAIMSQKLRAGGKIDPFETVLTIISLPAETQSDKTPATDNWQVIAQLPNSLKTLPNKGAKVSLSLPSNIKLSGKISSISETPDSDGKSRMTILLNSEANSKDLNSQTISRVLGAGVPVEISL